MAALIIGGVTVPVAPDGWREKEPLEVGEVVPAFDGTLRDSRRSILRRWQVSTRLLDSTEYTNVRAVLVAASPLAVSGDAIGSATDCVARITGGDTVKAGGAIQRSITFDLMEE